MSQLVLRQIIAIGRMFLFALVPTCMLAGIRFMADGSFEPGVFAQTWLWASGILGAAAISQADRQASENIRFSPATALLIALTFSLGIAYGYQENTLLAWLFLGGLYASLLGLISAQAFQSALWLRLLVEGSFALVAGLLPALLVQIETRFSTEEFFVAVESAVLILFWLVLRGMYARLGNKKTICENKTYRWQVNRLRFLIGLWLSIFAGGVFTIWAYQHSFYAAEAPGFPEITAQNPFVCGEAPASKEVYSGAEVFQNLVDQVAANPVKEAPEYGQLALASGEERWAQAFRDNLLKEAQEKLFTGPSGSVKYGQYLAGKRAYFYPLVRDAFPGLFSPGDEQIITDWFAAINRRTLTVEWVDWTYALALRYWPQGPYENQENGAGLLALLETNGLADPNLSAQNRQYLADNPRGWSSNFRVSDDAAVYQPEWMENAWFQSRYWEETNTTNRELSFEWLKALALPDGSPLRYNHVGAVQYANSAYWGANLLGDENLLWLAGRALENQTASPKLTGQPGAEQALSLTGSSPTLGSCLIYADSGLPTQKGPLAPDKIVFRSGWEANDIYLLLNLRFSGWHRYKATNAIVQLYQNEPLLVENYNQETFDWLPIGRSLFRDKRIPRENLNGLVIAKTGLAAVLYQITGIGGIWAQDPPYYSEVTHFETGKELTIASTQIKDWHGWQHQRTIYFYPQGVVVIFDNAQGTQSHSAALVWHVTGEAIDSSHIRLGNQPETGQQPEMALLAIENGPSEVHTVASKGGQPILQIQQKATQTGKLQTATVFLFNHWIGAQASVNDQSLTIVQGEQEIEIKLSEVFHER